MRVDARWTRVEDLFDGALEVPAAEREAWLAARCGEDAALQAEVQRMLAGHLRPSGILDRPLSVPPADTATRLQAALAGRYVVERELGRGGMATVYLAQERKHDRRVVLKVLKPGIALICGRERFLREVHIAARLAHPHILGLLDSGEADGLLFYVMPHVEGDPLRERLRRRGALPLDEAVLLLRDIADALAYAHQAGVVHRDLKPENVLCTGAHAFLMDFGVAKLVDTDADNVTAEGVALGTPLYMAPEQAAGDPETGHRADVYAWGLLAFEMITGRPLRERPAATGLILEELKDDHPELPLPLADLVEASLARQPGRRPDARVLVRRLEDMVQTVPTPAQTPVRRRRLPALVGATALVGVAVLAAVLTLRSGGPAEPLPGPVAVAALENETGDSTLALWGRLAGDWITQGLQETNLAAVVAWPTALQASERIAAARAAGRPVNRVAVMREETGARTVVSGSYYLVGDRIRLQVAITDAAGLPLSSPPPVTVARDSVEAGIRSLRQRVLGAVAVHTDEQLRTIPGVSQQPPTFESYRAFDRGLQLYNDQQYRAAIPELQRAYALDTTFLAPLVTAAYALWNTTQYAQVDSTLRLIRQRAVGLSPFHDAQVSYMEGLVVGDGDAALRAIRRATELAPSSRAAYNLAMHELSLGRPADAARTLTGIDPDGPAMRAWSSYWTQLTHALHLTGRHEEELAAARALRARFPERRVALVLETRALAALGRTAAIDSALNAAATLSPDTYWSQGAALVAAGEEYLVHGDSAIGLALLERAVRWFASQLARTPNHSGHREWLGSALYDLGRWADAEPYFRSLTEDAPGELRYQGRLALTAARLGNPRADELLGPEPHYNPSDHRVYRARMAAARGDREEAFDLLAEAFRIGVGGAAWLHALAARDLAPFRTDPRYARLVWGPS